MVSIPVAATSGNLSPQIQLNSGATQLNYLYPMLPGGACSGALTQNEHVPLDRGWHRCGTNAGGYVIYAQLTDNSSGATGLPSGPTETEYSRFMIFATGSSLGCLLVLKAK